MEDVYVIEKRQDEMYDLSTNEWQDLCNKFQTLTRDKLRKERRKKDPKYEIPTDPRDEYWDCRPYQVCAFYGTDIPQTIMRKDLEV